MCYTQWLVFYGIMSWNQDVNKLGVKYLPTSILKKLEIYKTKTHNCVNAGYVETSYSKF